MNGIIVVLKSADSSADFERDLIASGYKYERVTGLVRFYMVEAVAPETFELRDRPYIQAIESQNAPITPDDQAITVGNNLKDWHLPRIVRRRAPWNTRRVRLPVSTFFRSIRTGVGVDIYVPDEGVDVSHPEFGGRAEQPYAYTDTPSGDSSGHGTACASLAAGASVGVARGSMVWSFRFSGVNGGAIAGPAITALGELLSHYQLRDSLNRPAVLSFSWNFTSSTISAAINDIIDAGMVCCFSAGNDMVDTATVDRYPTESDPDGVVCGGTAPNDAPYYLAANGTNWGAELDIVAPAQSINVANRTIDGGGYKVGSGTSYAAPLVAGVVACMLEGYGRLAGRAQVQAVKAKLLANATTGQVQQAYGLTLPDRLLYLDPNVEFEVIQGLTPRLP